MTPAQMQELKNFIEARSQAYALWVHKQLRRDLTAVVIDHVDPRDWFIAGKSLAELKMNSFYFDIKVVDETNTKAEKAKFVAEAFEAFGRILGDLHPESYVYVQDVRGSAYGYGGRTQEYRHQHPDQ